VKRKKEDEKVSFFFFFLPSGTPGSLVLHPASAASASSASAAVAVEGWEMGWALGPVFDREGEKTKKKRLRGRLPDECRVFFFAAFLNRGLAFFFILTGAVAAAAFGSRHPAERLRRALLSQRNGSISRRA